MINETSPEKQYEFLTRDRNPSAVSPLSVISGKSNAGKIEFYSTPLGTLVCAELTGMPESDGGGFDAYFLEIDGRKNASHISGGRASYRTRTSNLPPVFTRCGKGKVSFMTDRFSVLDLVGRSIFLRRDGQSVACGEILPCGRD